MFCMYCGTKNEEGYAFCKTCGKKLMGIPEEPEAEEVKIPSAEVAKPTESNGDKDHSYKYAMYNNMSNSSSSGIRCPKCGTEDGNCRAINKTNTTTTGSNYNAGGGCCGLVFLGPFGLLCGLCGSGQKTTTQNQTWWVCQKCGYEFPSKGAVEDEYKSKLSAISIFIGLISMVMWNFIFFGGGGLAALCAITIAILWGVMWTLVPNSSKVAAPSLFNHYDFDEFKKTYFIWMVCSTFFGLAFTAIIALACLIFI